MSVVDVHEIVGDQWQCGACSGIDNAIYVVHGAGVE